MAKTSESSTPTPVYSLPALIPNLHQITQSVITKADLLEMVQAEEEESLKRQIQECTDGIAEIHRAFEKSVFEKYSKDMEEKLAAVAKSYGCKVDKFKFRAKKEEYDEWRDYQQMKISNKKMSIIQIDAYCNGPDVTLKLEMERSINDDPGIAQIQRLEKQKEKLKGALEWLPKTINRISAGITRKALESANEGKQILSLLQSLRKKLHV